MNVSTTYKSLIVERVGVVGWLWFNRPEKRNAMDLTMRQELPRAWRQLDEDPQVSVVVCSGKGGTFSSGLDVDALRDPASAAEFRRDVELPHSASFTPRDVGVRKPVIAAVNGLCVGGALMWVVDADIAIAAADATFADPHTALGQVVGRGTLGAVPSGGFGAVMRLALVARGTSLGAQRAFQLGLVSQVVEPPDRLHDEAQILAELIARNSPAAMAATKRAMWRALDAGLDVACTAASDDIAAMWSHPDQTEGPAAFMQQRQPNWAPLT